MNLGLSCIWQLGQTVVQVDRVVGKQEGLSASVDDVK